MFADDFTSFHVHPFPHALCRVSFETGMTQMGGHAIYYDIGSSPMGQKETVEDTAKV